MKWEAVKLDSIKGQEKGSLVSGPFGSNIGSRFFVDEGVPLIRGNNLSMGKEKFIENGFAFITEDKARELKNCNTRTDDIIFTAAGSLGQVGIIPKTCRFPVYIISNKQIRLRLDTSKAFPLYLYYFLSSRDMRAFIASQNKGSSVPLLTLGIIRNLKVLLPSIIIQKKIAAVISAYTDLIENNQRRIALLETMAEELYREWFVRMRFPGYEKVKKIKGVPENWPYEKAFEFFGLVKGKSYAGDELSENPEHMPFITLKSFNRGGGYREDGLKYYSGRCKPEQVVHQNDVVMAVTDMTQDRAIVGQVARVPDLGDKGAVISLDTVRLVPKKINRTFLYAYMRHSGFANYIKEFANGANVLHLKPDLITQQRIVVPPKELQDQFAPIAEPLYAQADKLSEANSQLIKTRDALLPRLISGKLTVEHLDIQFPHSMAENLKTKPAHA